MTHPQNSYTHQGFQNSAGLFLSAQWQGVLLAIGGQRSGARHIPGEAADRPVLAPLHNKECIMNARKETKFENSNLGNSGKSDTCKPRMWESPYFYQLQKKLVYKSVGKGSVMIKESFTE